MTKKMDTQENKKDEKLRNNKTCIKKKKERKIKEEIK